MRRGFAVLVLLTTALSPAPSCTVTIDFEGFGDAGAPGRW